MKIIIKSTLIILLLTLFACGNKQKTYNIAVSPTKKGGEYNIIRNITEKYSKSTEDKIQFKLNCGVDYTFEKNIANVAQKSSDFAVIYNDIYNTNNQKIDSIKGVRTVLPISSKFLYIIHNKNLKFTNIENLFEGRRIAILSYDKKMIQDVLFDLGVDTNRCQFVKTMFDYSIHDTTIHIDSLDYFSKYKNFKVMPYDIEVSFTPVNYYTKNRLTKFLKSHDEFTFFSIDDYKLYKQGSFVDGFCMKNKYFSPYIIPKGLFGLEPQLPILTVRQDLVLIAKSNLESEVVFDFVKYAIEKSGKIDMTLFGTGFENINAAFPYHEGTLIYLNKTEPTFIERYGEKIAKFAAGIGAANSALIYFFLWRKKRRKKVLNNEFIKLLDYKEKLHRTNDISMLNKYYSEIKDIRMNMAKQIKNEKIIVDDNISIINDLIQNLEDYYYEKISSQN